METDLKPGRQVPSPTFALKMQATLPHSSDASNLSNPRTVASWSSLNRENCPTGVLRLTAGDASALELKL